MLASCGKEVKIHEWPDGALVGGVSSRNGVTFSGLCWTYPGNKLLAIPTGHCPILLQESKTEHINDIFIAKPLRGLNAGIECGIFPNTIDNILTIAVITGELLAYDIEQQCLAKHYVSLPEPVLFLDYTFDDTLMAAGCRDGKIYFYDSNGLLNTSYQIPNSTTLTSMMFHPHNESLLATANKEGILAIFDVNTGKISFQAKNHQSTVSGICMVPQDDVLITVGQDKKVLFYDLRTYSQTNCLNFGTEITAVAYYKENEDVLIGTTEGRIMCIDRRNPAVLKRTFDSQKNCSVKKIAFNKRPNLKIYDTSHEITYKLHEELSFVSRMHAGMDRGINESKGDMMSEDNIADCSRIPLYQVIEENSLRALKQEILNTNKGIMRKFMEDITDQFLKIRLEVSREFCHLEQTQNKKWKEFHGKLAKLALEDKKGGNPVASDSQLFEDSESYRADSSRFDGKESCPFKRNP